jgi:hypothetical protein
MSQHSFKTEHQGKPVTVVMDYDRPLKHVLMSIMGESSDDADDEAAGDARESYTSLDDEDAALEWLDVNYYRRILERLNIIVPVTMFSEVMRDQNENIGNRRVTHYLGGSMETPP